MFHPSAEAVSNSKHGYAGHGGGDSRGFLEDFVQATNGQGKALTTATESIQSHLIAFALEESRLTEKIIKMDEYKKRF